MSKPAEQLQRVTNFARKQDISTKTVERHEQAGKLKDDEGNVVRFVRVNGIRFLPAGTRVQPDDAA